MGQVYGFEDNRFKGDKYSHKELSFPLQSSEGLQATHAQSPGLARHEHPGDPAPCPLPAPLHMVGVWGSSILAGRASHFWLTGLPQSPWPPTELSIQHLRKAHTQCPSHMLTPHILQATTSGHHLPGLKSGVCQPALELGLLVWLMKPSWELIPMELSIQSPSCFIVSAFKSS